MSLDPANLRRLRLLAGSGGHDDSTARSEEVLIRIFLVTVIVLALLNSASHRSSNERRS
jgi:preprotein translocase subunit SecG